MPMPPEATATTPAPDRDAQVRALVDKLVAHPEFTDVHHGVVLDALLSTYATTLLRHPCCIPSALVGLQTFWVALKDIHQAHLARRSQDSDRVVPPGAPLH